MKNTLHKISKDIEKGFSTPLFVFIVALVGLAAYLVYTNFIR